MHALENEKSVSMTSVIAKEFQETINDQRRRSRIIDMAPFIILIVMAVLMSVFIQGFFTVDNLIAILNQMASPLVLSMGLTFVILLGSIDLSVEGIMGFTGSVVTILVLNNKTSYDLGIWGILLAVFIGTAVGFLNGVLHVKLRIPSFMVTFGMASIMTGFGVMSYMGRPATVNDPMFTQVSQGSFLGIPLLTWFSLMIFAVAYIVQNYTAFGRHIYAIGENEKVLRSTGINVDRKKIVVFTLSALCSSIAGIFGAIRLNRGEVVIGSGYLFYTITAVAVGGTALWGGRGGVVQSLVGVLIVTIIKDSMILMGVNPYIQSSVQGVLIILAVALTVVRGKKVIIK